MPVDDCLCRGAEPDCPVCFGRGRFSYPDEDEFEERSSYLSAGMGSGFGEGAGEVLGEVFCFIFEALAEMFE